jgi:hypothetical protein
MGLLNKLGIGIGTGLVSLGLLGTPDFINMGLLEDRVTAAEQIPNSGKPLDSDKVKKDYTFDEVKSALGERYTRLTDSQKKTVENNYKSEKGYINFSHHTILGLVYSKKTPESLRISDDELKEIADFKISELRQEELDEYLTVFPWIKKENIAKIDKDPKNPDKMLIYYTEFYRQLEHVSNIFKDN